MKEVGVTQVLILADSSSGSSSSSSSNSSSSSSSANLCDRRGNKGSYLSVSASYTIDVTPWGDTKRTKEIVGTYTVKKIAYWTARYLEMWNHMSWMKLLKYDVHKKIVDTRVIEKERENM